MCSSDLGARRRAQARASGHARAHTSSTHSDAHARTRATRATRAGGMGRAQPARARAHTRARAIARARSGNTTAAFYKTRAFLEHNLRSEHSAFCERCVLIMQKYQCPANCTSDGRTGHNIQDGNRMQHLLPNFDGQHKDDPRMGRNKSRTYSEHTILVSSSHFKKKQASKTKPIILHRHPAPQTIPG